MIRDDDPLRAVMPWLDDAAAEKGAPSIEREELVRALHDLAEHEGADVTLMRFLKESGFKEYHVYKHFASWAELRTEAGLPPRRTAEVIHTDEELLAEAVRVIEECGRFPPIREFNERSRYPYHALYMRFGRRADILRRCEEYGLCRDDAQRDAVTD